MIHQFISIIELAESHIRGILNKISAVRLYNIDTESDKPTRQHPHPLPALIQIQAIHDEILFNSYSNRSSTSPTL